MCVRARGTPQLPLVMTCLHAQDIVNQLAHQRSSMEEAGRPYIGAIVAPHYERFMRRCCSGAVVV